MKRFFKITTRCFLFVLAMFLSFCVAAVLILFFEGELSPNNFPRHIVSSFNCDYKRTYHFDKSFRDIFAFSQYNLSEPQVDTELFAPVTNDVLPRIGVCIGTFETCVRQHKNCTEDKGACEVIQNYSFDRSTLGNDDYFRLDGVAPEFELYIFDTATNTLYHFHLTF